ncbi:Glycosyl transferase family 2 [Neorhodopirellula lusitana]|uniref:Glycosyl transferase family 2 n=2 Tax=Neorhodopirellula lusitana TaxID=445327 RepID=A0ABY1PW18_9BACT|nr:Glycosyl transferase family 2 [Neorhodopirellula lusitana]
MNPQSDCPSPGPTQGNMFDASYVAQITNWLGSDACRQLSIYALPDEFRLTVIVPVYNECDTVQEVIAKLRKTGLPLEIILVDDGSDDGSSEVLSKMVLAGPSGNTQSVGLQGVGAVGVGAHGAGTLDAGAQRAGAEAIDAYRVGSNVAGAQDASVLEPGGEVASAQVVGDVQLIRHQVNRGKGAAIRTGVEAATGDVIVIQDADSEYNPDDLRGLLQPLVERSADVVYGTRYGHCDRQLSPWWHQAVNAFITMLASVAIGPRLSDVETCYKMARTEHFKAVLPKLKEDRFGIEIELTARFARMGLRFTERPIRYQHRWYDEGKKITWKDGVAALYCIAKYGFLKR